MPAGCALAALRRPDGEILEHAGAARDRHQDHHAGEQADGVPVDAVDRLFLVEHADDDHHAGADQRDDRAVDLLRHDGGVGDGEDAGGHPHRVQAEIDVRGRVRGHSRTPQNSGRPASTKPNAPRLFWPKVQQARQQVKVRLPQADTSAHTLGPSLGPLHEQGAYRWPANVRFSNPKTMAKPPGYTYVVEATGPNRLIFIAGQLGLDMDNQLVGAHRRFPRAGVQGVPESRNSRWNRPAPASRTW